MKRKSLFLLTLLLVVFSTGQVLATGDEVIEADDSEVLELEKEVEEIIEDIEEVLEEQEDIIEEEEIIEEELELRANDVESIPELDNIIGDSIKKGRNILDTIENQYNLKKQFVNNSKTAYTLTVKVKDDLKDVSLEMKDIVKDKERKIDKETYGEIRETTGDIEKAIKESEYLAGSILRETKNYVGYLRNKEFEKASESFQQILLLQEYQVNLLTTVNQNIIELKTILENA